MILFQGKEYGRLKSSASSFSHSFTRARRLPIPTHRVIDPVEDCFLVTSEEGELFFKSPSDEPTVCGIYMIADPDKRIQVSFNYVDVPCENGGLVAWVDGWELNGQVWPADLWDDDRVVESCDRRPQRKLVSHQNAALIQYRVPAQGKGFAVTIRHLRNARPSVEGKTILSVAERINRRINTRQCVMCMKRGLSDYVEIGGASGLDHTKMEVLDSVCGLDSNEGHRSAYIACENTVVRLVSSGRYHNSVTLAFAPLPIEDIEHSDLICGLNAL
ncbi:unnamed protein product [Diatraea saccharalis]|uniref:Corticotropin-releasing factor-binding protein n=1 Tax=Diatraea saccharalis TaxID=40085 RepID=A0A9N9RD05_9NEOP|nr:unnamed protein product [Diatraea saccharalis]